MDELPDILNTEQTCEVLECSRTTLWRLVRDERITPIPQKTQRSKPALKFRRADVLKLREEGWTRRYYY